MSSSSTVEVWFCRYVGTQPMGNAATVELSSSTTFRLIDIIKAARAEYPKTFEYYEAPDITLLHHDDAHNADGVKLKTNAEYVVSKHGGDDVDRPIIFRIQNDLNQYYQYPSVAALVDPPPAATSVATTISTTTTTTASASTVPIAAPSFIQRLWRLLPGPTTEMGQRHEHGTTPRDPSPPLLARRDQETATRLVQHQPPNPQPLAALPPVGPLPSGRGTGDSTTPPDSTIAAAATAVAAVVTSPPVGKTVYRGGHKHTDTVGNKAFYKAIRACRSKYFKAVARKRKRMVNKFLKQFEFLSAEGETMPAEKARRKVTDSINDDRAARKSKGRSHNEDDDSTDDDDDNTDEENDNTDEDDGSTDEDDGNTDEGDDEEVDVDMDDNTSTSQATTTSGATRKRTKQAAARLGAQDVHEGESNHGNGGRPVEEDLHSETDMNKGDAVVGPVQNVTNQPNQVVAGSLEPSHFQQECSESDPGEKRKEGKGAPKDYGDDEEMPPAAAAGTEGGSFHDGVASKESCLAAAMAKDAAAGQGLEETNQDGVGYVDSSHSIFASPDSDRKRKRALDDDGDDKKMPAAAAAEAEGARFQGLSGMEEAHCSVPGERTVTGSAAPMPSAASAEEDDDEEGCC